MTVEIKEEKKHCKEKTEIYSRVVGFFRPILQWNPGMREQYRKRKNYNISELKD